ncbi:unnamed protein product, partial [Staurois parvus]
MSDLHTSRLETESVKKQLSDALAQLSLRDSQRQIPVAVRGKKEQDTENSTVEQDLRKEVEDLKLRLQMAADHYKDKFKECQKLQKQVVKLKSVEEKQKETDVLVLSEAGNAEALNFSPSVNPFSSDSVPEFVIKEQVADMNKEIVEKTEKYRKCKQLLAIQSSEKDREISELSCHVEVLLSEKSRLEDTVKELEINLERLSERVASGQTLSGSSSQGLQFFNPYCEEHRAVPIIPIQPPVL